MAVPTLLKLLASGEFCSGQALADALQISRTAVWKQVNKMQQELGLEIESVRGRGYRIPGGVDLLREDDIRKHLTPDGSMLLGELIVHDVIDSTNTDVLRRARAGGVRGLVCAAEQQTAGRGRRGRRWVSPFASNIYLSLLWEYEQGAAALEGLSLAVGLMVARALEGIGVSGVQLKWPNDVLHRSAKLGGILLEMEGDAAGPCKVVVGVGLNVAMSRSTSQEVSGEIDQAWTDVASISPEACARSVICAALISKLLPMLAQFEQGGFSAYQQEWLALDAYANQSVVLDTGTRRLAGTARGVDPRGALLLETTAGVQPIYGGEVSLRPATDG